MGHSVLLRILILSLSLFYKLENAKGRSLLVSTSASVSLHSPLSSASLLDDPLARGNAPTKPHNSTDTGSPFQIDKVSHRINKGLLLAIIILPIFIGCIMIYSVCTWLYRKAYNSAPSSSQPHAFKRNSDPDTSDAYRSITLIPLLNRLNSRVSKKKGCATTIEYSKLQAGTNNFSSNNILGEGGFGCVYKARFDDDSFAAVKKLDESSRQAEHEFQNEVELMSKIRHPNLVSLLGFCAHENTRFLVYDLMQNGSLEDQLHGPSHGSALTWFLRMKIALDSARGLEHLHEHCNPAVIHRDFKSSNILLDASFNAKLSDFGLAVTTVGCAANTNIDLVGTFGYVAPEYLLDGKLTEKSDVYAYGVVLLELLFGRKPIDKSLPSECQSLISWAMPQLTDRAKLPTIVDPMIKGTMNLKHLYQVAAVAVLCVQPEPSYRPLIADVVHSLIPLVPAELGGTLKISPAPGTEVKSFASSQCSAKIASNPKL